MPKRKPLPNAEMHGHKPMSPDDPRRLQPGQSVLIGIAPSPRAEQRPQLRIPPDAAEFLNPPKVPYPEGSPLNEPGPFADPGL
jgi:hypothetical protein